MCHGLYAFGDHLALEGSSQSDNALQNGQVIGVVEHVAHKALVDLEQRHAQALEVGQRRVAGAKVVQRKLHTNAGAIVNHLRHLHHVIERAGLQYLQFNAARLHLRVLCQDRLQARHKVTLLQLARADVDAHRQVQPGGVPHFHLMHGAFKHPLAHLDGQRVVFDDVQEGHRRQQAFFRVLPADQGLGSRHLAAAHVDLGLVVQHELAALQCHANAPQAFVMVAQAAVMRGIKHTAAVLARHFGLVHGLVGLAQELVGIDVLRLRVEGDAQAGRNLQAQAVHLNRQRRCCPQAIEQIDAGRRVFQVG